MRPLLLAVFCALMLFANLSCSVNVLEGFASKTTDEALYEDALALMNKKDYTAALEKIGLMTSKYTVLRKVINLKSSAKAGLCGLEFMPFVLALKDIGTTRLFPFLNSAFKGGNATRIDYCLEAEDLIESIGTVDERNSDENMFLVLISFAKMGAILNLYSDTNADGTADHNDACTVGASRAYGNFTDADIRQLGTGMTIAMENLNKLSSEIDLGSGQFTAITSVCTSLTTYLGVTLCAKTNPADFSAAELKAIRSLIKEDSSVGLDIGGCDGGVQTCNCP